MASIAGRAGKQQIPIGMTASDAKTRELQHLKRFLITYHCSYASATGPITCTAPFTGIAIPAFGSK